MEGDDRLADGLISKSQEGGEATRLGELDSSLLPPRSRTSSGKRRMLDDDDDADERKPRRRPVYGRPAATTALWLSLASALTGSTVAERSLPLQAQANRQALDAKKTQEGCAE